MNQSGYAARIRRFIQVNTSLSWGASLAVLMALACALGSHSQGPPRDIINRPPPMPTDPADTGNYDPTVAERQQRLLNAERQKEMVSDTNKLLKLARELNYDVAASGSETLTPDDLHKLAEIEKLARSVKEKMAVEMGAPPPAMSAPVRFPSQ